jgi:hypothetical protein
MLTNTDRKGIRDSLKAWSQRRNIDDEILNDFIELALSKANRALRIPPLERAITLAPLGAGYYELPTDFIEVKTLIAVRAGKAIVLERKAIDEVDHLYSRDSQSDPCIYGRYGDTLRVAPDPGSDITLYYYYAIPSMTADVTTNWFTEQAPEILLYGALIELASYTRDPDSEARWSSKFNEAVTILQGMEDRAAWWSGGTVAVSINGST